MAAISVLGPVAVGDETLSPRDRVVLSVLVTRRGREVSVETLAEALWGEDLPASWAKVVQGCIARLRRSLGSEAILTGRGGYRLAVPTDDVDVGRFERLVRRARELLALDHPDQAAYAADEAIALWRGAPLPDLEEWEPGRGEAQRLVELRLQAEELRLAALLASGHHAEVLSEATLRVREEPLREHRWALLARAQYQDGRQAEALATLRRARAVLSEELGLDPGAELVRLERLVLEQDPSLAVPVAELPAAGCPWPGLASYEVDDADTFFGREAEVTECLDKLSRTGFVAVVGPSGSGKSSLVRAGLAARLRNDGRRVHVITPGPRPLASLAAATAHPASARVLVVDQCEEVFAPTVPGEVCAQFLSGVVTQTVHGPVVLTLRADRLGELTAYPRVAQLVEDGLYLLKAMGTGGLCEAIERPARQAGLLLEPGLVDLLVRDVEGEPGSLPLLAHALRQTWERRVGNTLTVEGYRASGGIRGAVAQSAEQVWTDATDEQRGGLRELFLRMVQSGPGGDPVRTSVARDTLTDDPTQAALVEQLVRARLVTAEADRLAIAHEALARAWPRLQSWLADDVAGERIRHHLTGAAEGWHAMGRPSSELYRGARLAAAREWRDTGAHRLSEVEEDFLAASEAAHQSRLVRAETEVRRQRTVNRRLRLLVVGTTLLAVVAATLGGMARVQWESGKQASTALSLEADRARAQGLAASSVATVGQDPELALALAVLGGDTTLPNFQVRDALHRAVAADRIVSRVSMDHYAPDRLWAVLHPDGGLVAMTAEHGYSPAPAIEVHDARTGDLVWEWVRPERPGYESAVMAGAQYSPDGAILAGGVLWYPASDLRLGPSVETAPAPADDLVGVHLWDARTHDHLGVVDVGPCGGWPMAIAGDHLLVRTLVAPPSQDLSAEEEASLLRECRWDDGAMGTMAVNRTTGESHLVAVVEELNLFLTFGHALSDDGLLAAVPDGGGEGVLVETVTGREVAHLGSAFGHDFDRSGERLLIAEANSDAWHVVSVTDLTRLSTFTGHEALTFYGRFGPDDSSALTTGLDNVLMVWDASTGEPLRTLPATGSGPPTVAGDLVLVPRPETVGAVVVDTSPPGELWSVSSCQGLAGADRLRVAGDLVVVGRDCDGQAQGRLETYTRTGDLVHSWPGVSWEALGVSPDGRLVVSRDGAGSSETGTPMVGPLRVRELDTGQVVVTLDGFCEHSLPDAYTGIDVDDRALQTCGRLGDPPFTFSTWVVRWSADGRWIAAVSANQGEGVAVWDARTGALVTSLATTGSAEQERWTSVWDVRFSPGSDLLHLSTMAGHLVAVDTTTWQPVLEQELAVQNAYAAGVVGPAANGSLVVVTPLLQNAANSSILLVDPETLKIDRLWTDVAEGTVQAADLSPDGTRLALATSEGTVSVWEMDTGRLLDQAGHGLGRLDGVQWLDDQDLVLLTAAGHLTTVTTDTGRLLGLARASLTRGLTQSECTAYDVDPCPSLATMLGSEPVVPEELRGTYALTWTPDEFLEAALGHAERAYGELDEASLASLTSRTAGLAGTYRLELREGDYTMTRGEAGEVLCTGSITRVKDPPDRLRLGATSGTRCVDFHYAQIGWELDGEQLTLPREEFHGAYFDTLLWTGKPLQKVG